ncbi:hypothetical protein GQ457_07G002370 [Hibiscus cannabinus]
MSLYLLPIASDLRPSRSGPDPCANLPPQSQLRKAQCFMMSEQSKVRYQLGVNKNMGTNSSSSSQLPIPLFNGEKYQFWSVKMHTLFKSQDLWELVEEGIAETDDAAKTNKNKKKDAKALYLLQQAIHDDFFPTILSASSSKEAWLTLQQEYRGDSKVITVRLQTLRREFETSMMKKDETIQDFLSRVKSIVSQMRNYGEKCSDHIVVTKVLRSLTSRFDHVVAAIEESKDLTQMSFDELMGSLQAHEARINRPEENIEEKAFHVKGEYASGAEDLKRADEQMYGRGRRRYTGRGRGRGRTQGVQCHYCKRYGHVQAVCWRKQNQANYTEEAEFDEEGEEDCKAFMAWVDSKANNQQVWFLDSGYSHHMTASKAYGKVLVKASMTQNKLFPVDLTRVETCALIAQKEEVTALWHRRYGHININNLKMLQQKEMVKGMLVLGTLDICEACIYGKQSKKPFSTQKAWRATKFLELVHGDLCGPMQTETFGGSKYFLLFTDDFSRMSWVFFLKKKDEALDFFKKFKNSAEKQSEKLVKALRTDRGGGFTSKDFWMFCEENGIHRELTSPYTPEQNGVAECKNRIVVEMARSMLQEKGLPNHFWGEAVATAVYILNISPTRAVPNQTPYEVWTGRRPRVSHLRIFGCVAYTLINTPIRSKLDNKALKCVFVGYCNNSKAYRLFNPVSGKIVISRNVIFNEEGRWIWRENNEGTMRIEELIEENQDHETEGVEPIVESEPSMETVSESSSLISANCIYTGSTWKQGEIEAVVIATGVHTFLSPQFYMLQWQSGLIALSLQGTITKRMTAIEEMAGMDVLCNDKTGTSTLNKLSVDKNLIEDSTKTLVSMPKNPSLYAGAVTGVLDGDRPALASSLVNGRPPDQVSRVVSGPVLERPGSPLAKEVQRDNKKVRNQGGVDADESVTEMDVETDTGTTENSMRSGDLAKEQVRLSTDTTRLSYANVVGKSRSKGGFSSDGLELDPHQVVVLDEDCVVDREGKFPTIKFSKRVHDQIDSTMRNVIIVCLLGRNIGYQSLLNRIHALWKPSGDLQLIDLENNYFLVRVEDPRDYERILTEGPWTIYGNYLTVQPWSRSFSTSEKHPSRVVVWVRLPGLPYRYYSKALFRRIAAIVGEVVRVDYNTQAGERGKFARLAVTVDLNKPLVPCLGIDDFTQQLEYEGLQNICFKCGIYGHSQDICTHDPRSGNGVINQKQSSVNMGVEVSKEADKENLFGPWMVVDSRRRQPPGTRGISRDVGQGMGSALGSRFAVLEGELINPAVEQGAGTEVGEQQGEPVSQGALNEVELHSTQPSRAEVGKKGKATEAGNGSGNKGGTGQGLLATAVVLPMVEGQQVSVVEHTGHSKVYAAVSIFEHGHGKAGSAKIGTGKQVAGKAKGLKENAKQGLKVRKSAEMRTVARSVLSDWIDNMNTQLDRFGMDKDLDPGGDTRVCVNQEGVLEKVPSSRSQAMSETRTGDIETSDRVLDLAR